MRGPTQRLATPRARRLARALALLVALTGLAACGASPDARPIPAALPAAEREAARRLPLDGAHNARDLGGYVSAGGRAVRWGVLYRSDALADLSDDDVAYLARLGLRRVVDFRSEPERARDPDRLPASLPVTWRPIFGDALDPATLRDRLLSGEARADEMSRMLVEGNRAFVGEFAPVYSAFLRDLAAPENLPALFHCTAGKDRAGYAAALALLAVGVPRETVMHDYLLTNRYSEGATSRTLLLLRVFSGFRTDPDDARPLFEARSEYLRAAFDAIDARYGDTDRYLREGLGLDEPTLARLRENLLEP